MQTVTFSLGRFRVRLSPSASLFGAGEWDANATGGHPFKGLDFLRIIQESFPRRKFCFASVFLEDSLSAQVLLTLETIDAVMFAPGIIKALARVVRRVSPNFLRLAIVTVGTSETHGAHWWRDRSAISDEDLAAIIELAARSAFARGHVLVVRDFLSSSEGCVGLLAALKQRQFVEIAGLPIATIRTTDTSEKFFLRLHRKTRKTIRRLPGLASKTGIAISVETEFAHLIDECYPLFMNVHERSTQLQREPIPIEFFRGVAGLPNSRMAVARSASGKIVAFILTRTNGTVACPALIGLDYSFPQEALLYHQLLWTELTAALDAGCTEIDLGVTSYFVKQGYGAMLDPSRMMVRFQHPFLRRVLNPIVPGLLKVEQPMVRRRSADAELSHA